MSRFKTFGGFKYTGKLSGKYALTEDLRWDLGKENSGFTLIIEKGIEFDISVPKYFEWLQSKHDLKLLPAAAIHDELLKRDFSLISASNEFRRAAKTRGIKTPYSWFLFISTLIWTAFNRRKKNNN